MMFTETEIKLLKLRQKYRDALVRLVFCPVVSLNLYRRLTSKFHTTEVLLREYRQIAIGQRRQGNERLF